MIMNKKGFTLIEGLMVIAIIGILLLTLIPSVITIINKNKHKNFENTRDSIIKAAEMYVAENKYHLDIDCDPESYLEVKLSELVGSGNLSGNLYDYIYPNVEVNYDCSKKEFDFYYKDADNVYHKYSTLGEENVEENNEVSQQEVVNDIITITYEGDYKNIIEINKNEMMLPSKQDTIWPFAEYGDYAFCTISCEPSDAVTIDNSVVDVSNHGYVTGCAIKITKKEDIRCTVEMSK